MLTSPTRDDVPLFAATSSATVALALPFCGDPMAIHDTWLAAFQAQPDSVVMVTDTAPPAGPIVSCDRPSA